MAAAAPGKPWGEDAPAPRAAPPPVRGVAALPVKHRWLLMIGVMLGTIIQILDSTIANVALPHMQSALGATADTITWVLTSYIVASAIAIPLTGFLSDRLGSRNLFLLAVAGFVIASALCGMAQSLEEMVLFRVLQGIAAAFMNPLSQTAMLDISPPEEQGSAMAIWGMGIMVGPIMGPVIGGWLTENFDWRWVFYVNLPLGIVCIAILWWLLPSRPLRPRSFDLFGFSMLSIGIASFQLMLDRGQSQDWFGSTEIWIEAVIAALGLWMFAIHMATGKRPMFERELFRNVNLMTGVFFMLVTGLVMMATMALLPPMLQQLYGYSVLQTGLMLTPRGIGVVISMAIVARLMQKGMDPRILIAIGLTIAAGSLWQMTGWSLVMGTTTFLLSGFVQGLGLGLMFTPLQNVAFATLTSQYRTEGSSLMNLSRSIGASVGISAVTTLLARNIQVSHADLAPHFSAEGLQSLDPNLLQALGGVGESVMAMANAEINKQAAMIAYLDNFWLMAIVTILAVPLVLVIRRPKGPVVIDPGAAGH